MKVLDQRPRPARGGAVCQSVQTHSRTGRGEDGWWCFRTTGGGGGGGRTGRRAEHQVGVCGAVRSQLVPEIAELGEGHLPAQLHHLPEHLLHCRHRTHRTSVTNAQNLSSPHLHSGLGLTVLLLDQPLLDVANVGEEVADGCDLRRNKLLR